jgi:hypothetical protein
VAFTPRKAHGSAARSPDEGIDAQVDLNAFTGGLPRLSGSDIRLISKALDASVSTPEDEVTWWRATMLVDKVLRRSGMSRNAAIAAQAAGAAVKAAAESDGLRLPDADVTRVARGAASMARAMVAGSPAAEQLELFSAVWQPYLESEPPESLFAS